MQHDGVDDNNRLQGVDPVFPVLLHLSTTTFPFLLKAFLIKNYMEKKKELHDLIVVYYSFQKLLLRAKSLSTQFGHLSLLSGQ